MLVRKLSGKDHTTMRVRKVDKKRFAEYRGTMHDDDLFAETVDILDRLANYGKKNESFTEIADRLIQFWEENRAVSSSS